MDTVIKSEILFDESAEKLIHRTTQPTENIILDRNSELRKNPGAIRDLGDKSRGGTWGRQVACIPFILFEKAIRDGYQLNSKDSKFAASEMHRFLMSPEGKTCLVRD